MVSKINHVIDRLSEYFAHRKGLLPLLGILLIIVNFLLQFVPGMTWFSENNLFLHIGIILAIFGFLLAWAL